MIEDQIAKISVNLPLLQGVDIEAQLIRHYPYENLFSHAIGYVGRINAQEKESLDPRIYSATDVIGKTGIEHKYEEKLIGKPGFQEVETNASGRILRTLKRVNPKPGTSVQLHLDKVLQQVAMEALKGKRGAVVAMDPKTGGILALVSNPSFDANLFVTGIDAKTYSNLRNNPHRPLYNRATLGEYPPASTIKPFVGLTALLTRTVTPTYTIDDPGYFMLEGNDHKYRNWKRTGHGRVNLNKSLVVSNDTYIYTIAVKMGIDTIHKYLTSFGFGTKTGLDIAAERAGLVPSREWKKRVYNRPWYTGETVITGIGQGYMLVTPLQLAVATSLIANKGGYVKPLLLKNTINTQEDTNQNSEIIQTTVC